MNSLIARVETTSLIISNLIISEVLRPDEVAKFLAVLNRMDDGDLSRQLLYSKLLVNNYYSEAAFCMN